MEEKTKEKFSYHKVKTPKPNKIIFKGLSDDINFPIFIKNKNLKINLENISPKNFKNIYDRKKVASAPFRKRYSIEKFEYDYYNSDKQIQAASNSKRNFKLFSIINISSPFDQTSALYKNLKEKIIHKNFGKTTKHSNINLYQNITTNYLKQKESNNIPITYPFYSSFDKKCDSRSQKERYRKNLDKIIQVRTHLTSNKTDHYKIISEFMVKNGIKEKKYINPENMMKIESYLKQPINFNPDLTMTQIIKNIINNKINNTRKNLQNKIEDYKFSNYFNKHTPEFRNNLKIKYRTLDNNSKKGINNLKKSSSAPNLNLATFQDDSRIMNLLKKYSYLHDKNNLTKIIDKLESELKQLKTNKINKLEDNNKFNDHKVYLMKSFEDNNKFVPNLCLTSRYFSQKYKNNIKKYNDKVQSIISKNEKIKNINKRMYYDNKKNKSLKEFDLADIRKFHKITELVVLNRERKKLMDENIKKINIVNKIGNIFSKLK